jgi:hypothetical protein
VSAWFCLPCLLQAYSGAVPTVLAKALPSGLWPRCHCPQVSQSAPMARCRAACSAYEERPTRTPRLKAYSRGWRDNAGTVDDSHCVVMRGRTYCSIRGTVRGTPFGAFVGPDTNGAGVFVSGGVGEGASIPLTPHGTPTPLP